MCVISCSRQFAWRVVIDSTRRKTIARGRVLLSTTVDGTTYPLETAQVPAEGFILIGWGFEVVSQVQALEQELRGPLVTSFTLVCDRPGRWIVTSRVVSRARRVASQSELVVVVPPMPSTTAK